MTNECKIELIWSYLHKYFVNRNRSRNKCFTVHYDWVWTILAIKLNSWIIIHDLHLFTPHTCILLPSALRGAHQFFLNLYQTYKTFMNDRYYSSHYFSDKNVKSLYLPTETDTTVLILTFCLEILCLVFSDQFSFFKWHWQSDEEHMMCYHVTNTFTMLWFPFYSFSFFHFYWNSTTIQTHDDFIYMFYSNTFDLCSASSAFICQTEEQTFSLSLST